MPFVACAVLPLACCFSIKAGHGVVAGFSYLGDPRLASMEVSRSVAECIVDVTTRVGLSTVWTPGTGMLFWNWSRLVSSIKLVLPK